MLWPRRRPRCSSRTARRPPNSRNQQSAAANPSCSRGSPNHATTPISAPVASTENTPNTFRTCTSVATSSATAIHSASSAMSAATSTAPPSPSSDGAG
ncbi:hypothetical protein BJF78_08625 [Pseudonocardia sp. CNS-139]|nr:hypothetical protein BJF78_08625 [Pseudonocardia sp. CNS-139]